MRMGSWRVERTLGRDLAGTYYAARRDDGERASLYLLAGEATPRRREALTHLIEMHRGLSHPSLVRFHGLDHSGSEPVLLGEPVDDAIAALRYAQRPNAGQVAPLGAVLASALFELHAHGLVHGGLELDNVLWAPGHAPQILGAGVAVLGVADRVFDPVALARGDVAGLGRLLCALIAGWPRRGATRDAAAVIRRIADPAEGVTMRGAHAQLVALGGEPLVQAGTPARPALAVPVPPEVDVTGRTEDYRALTSGALSEPAAATEPGASRGGAVGDNAPTGGMLNRYRILTQLGRGGMGEVFLAEDPALGRGVAIKRIRPGLERDRTFRARLRREAQLAARLGHRAIVQVFDLVTHDDIDHLVMEYVPGPSLHALLAGSAMPAEAAVKIAIEIADGLEHAHRQDIVHRDLKLENILISTDGQPRIADFGIARRVTAPGAGLDGEASLTRDGFMVGTARAMSPEQIQGHDIDGRSDLFSFGVLLYELVTGASPFVTAADAQTMLRVLHHRPAPPRELVPELPAALSELIEHLLEKRPEHRPASARVVRDRLRRILDEHWPGADADDGATGLRMAPRVDASASDAIGTAPLLARPREASQASTRDDRGATGPAATGTAELSTGAPRAAGTGESSSRTTSPIATRGERRQVTVVCIDLAGASAEDRADPELLADVLPAFRLRLEEIIARYDGALISALGHRFVASFGHPRPLEDAARRSVLAARAALTAAAVLRSIDPVYARARFIASAAVHTGLAVVNRQPERAGDELGSAKRGSAAEWRGAGDELVLGATLDAALRLVQAARPGELWLSDAAARLVEADYELERPSASDGVTAARRFVGSRNAGTDAGEQDRPLVARDHELQLLLHGWQRARTGDGQVALLVGDPGIGKSRLTRALAAAVASEQPRQLVLRGSAHRQRSALEPVADAIAALLGFTGSGGSGGPGGAGTPSASSDSELAAATGRIRALTGSEEAEQVLYLLGRLAAPPVMPPDRARAQLLAGLRDVLVGSLDVPTLFLVEDLHWLDPSTLDLLTLVIQDVATAPLFLVMTTRPGFQPPWPVATTVTQLRLGRLDSAAIDAVIDQACAGRELAVAERAVIAARSEGVPLYAQELVRAALELGGAGGVPSTLRDALTARLHQLGPAATRVAHVAAVVGREVTPELIASAGGLAREAVDPELERLVAGEILLRRRGRGRTSLYQFSHALLQQAAYEELLAADRRTLHGQLAEALLADERDGRDPGPDVIAQHLAGAHRFAEAVAAAQRAAVRMLARHARVEARELFRQALGWLEQLPAADLRDRMEIMLRMQLGAVLIATEGYTSRELEQSSRRTEALCARHADMPFAVTYGLWAVRLMRGSPEEVAPFLAQFERVVASDAPAVERMMAHASIGTYAYARADYARAHHHLAQTMALFVPAEHAAVVQMYGGCGGFYGHVVMTSVLWQLGRFAEAWDHVRAAVAAAEALDPYALVSMLGFEMSLWRASGDVAQVEAIATKMLELTTRYGFPYLACSALCGRGWARAQRGDAGAMTDLLMGTGGLAQIGVKVWYSYSLGLRAEGALALGALDDAAQALTDAFEVSRASVDCGNEAELLRLRAQLALARDPSARGAAREILQQALAVARGHGARAFELRIAGDLARVLRDDGAAGEAIAMLSEVCAAFAADEREPVVLAARALLAELAA